MKKTLKGDLISASKGKLYLPKGEEVELISELYGMCVIQDKKGEKYYCLRKLIYGDEIPDAVPDPPPSPSAKPLSVRKQKKALPPQGNTLFD